MTGSPASGNHNSHDSTFILGTKMAKICRLRLDVLKPHKPNAYDFTLALSELDPSWRVELEVLEIDENTESVCLEIIGDHVEYDLLQTKITELGASIHSIDEVEAYGDSYNESYE